MSTNRSSWNSTAHALEFAVADAEVSVFLRHGSPDWALVRMPAPDDEDKDRELHFRTDLHDLKSCRRAITYLQMARTQSTDRLDQAVLDTAILRFTHELSLLAMETGETTW